MEFYIKLFHRKPNGEAYLESTESKIANRFARPIVREGNIANLVVYIDGLTGSGKSLITPIIGTFSRTRIGKVDHMNENLGALHQMGKLQDDAAQCLIKMSTDSGLYNLVTSKIIDVRNRNFSEVVDNVKFAVSKILSPEKDWEIKQIRRENSIFAQNTNQALSTMSVFFQALKRRLRVVEMVRHPLYLVERWLGYIDRFGSDPRDFTIWFGHNQRALPWFAWGWEEKYLNAPSFDRVLYSISHLTKAANDFYETLPESQKNQILFVPFEKFVLQPLDYVERLANLMETKTSPATWKVLKDQNCPRLNIGDEPLRPFANYFKNSVKTFETDPTVLRQQIFEKASPEAWAEFELACQDYEKRYGRWYEK